VRTFVSDLWSSPHQARHATQQSIVRRAGMNECTRCIGDYGVKGGYKENEALRAATSEPVIALPDVFGGYPIEEIEGLWESGLLYMYTFRAISAFPR